jgi:hypothetical protein
MTKSENAVRARRDSRVEVMSNVLIDLKGVVDCNLLFAKTYERWIWDCEWIDMLQCTLQLPKYSPASPPPSPSLFYEKEGDRHTTLQGQISPRHHHHSWAAPESAAASSGMLPQP